MESGLHHSHDFDQNRGALIFRAPLFYLSGLHRSQDRGFVVRENGAEESVRYTPYQELISAGCSRAG